jgi:monoamine oxidase
VHVKHGHVASDGEAWELISRVMRDMQRAASRGKDRTFADFLAHSSHSEDAKRLATSYVEGFNAARSDVIGIASLAQDAKAADKIDGDHSFRLLNGYESIARSLFDPAGRLRLNCVVRAINWRAGSVEIHTESALNGRPDAFRSRRTIITVPLGVLQAEPPAPGAIAFDPQPGAALKAARRLRFGHAIRVVLRFRESFWEQNRRLSNAGFLLSQEEFFPTWWSALPVHAPILVGWSSGRRVDSLLQQTRAEVLSRALTDLARITNSSTEAVQSLLEAAYTHEWHTDPFSRGAYSYVPAGALAARKALAKPIAETLYFAGEATDLNGHSATVHGAIASGCRAAQQILKLGCT